MYDFKNVFYFHATFSQQGIISDVGGKALWDSEIDAVTLIGENFAEIVFWQHKENISQLIANSIKVAAEGKPLEIETTFRNNAAKISTIKGKFTPVFDQNNEVEKIIFSSIDVTEYVKEIEFFKKTSERYLYSAESAEVGLWFWNLTTGELFTTPTCNEIYGLQPNDIMTFERFIQVVHPDDLLKVQTALDESHTYLTDYDLEYRIIPKKGTLSWVSARGKTLREDENSLQMMGSVRNITHRKIYDQRIQGLLEAEKIARDQLEEVNREKDHFLALISHELRSPLNSILGWSKILLSKKIDEQTQRNALETIENSAKLQAKLISDLVDSSKIISGKLQFTFVSLSFKSLINQVYQSEKPLAEEKKITFILGDLADVRVMGDSLRLQQAISNLITNSIKFTPSGGEVFIESKEENGNVIFCIKDSGAGIPPEELPYIFKQYFQSKNAQNKTGLGLGLSIVKAIIIKHNGQVSVKNNDNGIGCTFFISLPIQKSKQSDSPVKPTSFENFVIPLEKSDNPLKNTEILVVEDNDDSREVLEFFLNQMGAKVHSVSSSKEGVSYLNSTESLPNLIISDISMPEEDGFVFIGKVRDLSDEKGGLIPAIALTAFVSSNDKKRIMESGFQKHHSKPFEPDVLVNDILEVLRA
ncbi:MAG TPA: ATP-binding protein [Pyrinomonadaceae bacterium]|nr:ATP-binding protein [Pyrinomonadaceae bacterium]